MSIREPIRRTGQPISAVGAESAPGGSEAGTAFRGVYIPTVQAGEVITKVWVGDNLSLDEVAPTFAPSNWPYDREAAKNQSSTNRMSVAVGGGRFGDDCPSLDCDAYPFTTDYLTDNTRIDCPGHNFQVDDTIKFNSKIDSGSHPGYGLPAPLETGWDNTSSTYWVKTVGTDWFTCSQDKGGATVVLTSDGDQQVGQAFEVTTTGLPEFWLIKYRNTGVGSYIAHNVTPEQYIAEPSSQPYNRMSFWAKLPLNFREYNSANREWNPWRNYVFGTFNKQSPNPDPGHNYETWNMHHYTKVFVEHHNIDGDWVEITVNPATNNIRSWGGNIVPDAQAICWPLGFLDSVTWAYCRFYDYYHHAGVPAGGGEYSVLVDRIRFYWQEPKYDLTFAWDSFVPNSFPSLIADGPVSVSSVSTGGDSVRITGEHRFHDDDPISIEADAGGTVPAGLTDGQVYYAKPVDAQNVQFAATPGGAAESITNVGTQPFRVHFKLAGAPHVYTYDFTLTNNEAGPVSGYLYTNNPTVRGSLTTRILDDLSAVVIDSDEITSAEITINAGSSFSGTMEVVAQHNLDDQDLKTFCSTGGVGFVPSDEYTAAFGSEQPGHAEPNVIRVNDPHQGPSDADVFGIPWAAFFRVRVGLQASDNTVQISGHGFSNDERIRFATVEVGDSLPAELSAATTYHVVNTVKHSNEMQFSETEGGGPKTFSAGTTASGYYYMYEVL